MTQRAREALQKESLAKEKAVQERLQALKLAQKQRHEEMKRNEGRPAFGSDRDNIQLFDPKTDS